MECRYSVYTQKYIFPYPFRLKLTCNTKLYSNIVQNRNEKLTLQSCSIQFERKSKYIFLSVGRVKVVGLTEQFREVEQRIYSLPNSRYSLGLVFFHRTSYRLLTLDTFEGKIKGPS